MTAYRFVTLTCDECHEVYDPGTARTAPEARRLARNEGWLRRGQDDLCPRHNPDYEWVGPLTGYERKVR